MQKSRFSKEKCVISIFNLYFEMTKTKKAQSNVKMTKKQINEYYSQKYVHSYLAVAGKHEKHTPFKKALSKLVSEICNNTNDINLGYLNYICKEILDAFCKDIHSAEVQNNIPTVLQTVKAFDPNENFYPRFCFAVAYTNSFEGLSSVELREIQKNAQEYIQYLADCIQDATDKIEYYQGLASRSMPDSMVLVEGMDMVEFEHSNIDPVYYEGLRRYQQILAKCVHELETLGISLANFNIKSIQHICDTNIERQIDVLRGRS